MTMDGGYSSDLEFAHQLADSAAAISLSYFRREIGKWSKADGSLATEGDIATEDHLRERIACERPGDCVLGEERGLTGEGRRRWIIDAIDGTVAFAAGGPDWGTLIALEVDGRIVVGICDEPAHQRRYWATRGGGAFQTIRASSPSRLDVTTVRDLSSARSYLPPPQFQPNERARRIAAIVSNATKPTPYDDHPALQVASGGFEIAIWLRAGPWDIAAPAVIVEEAGGRFTNVDGAYDFTTGSAVFSNGYLHDEVLSLIKSAPGID